MAGSKRKSIFTYKVDSYLKDSASLLQVLAPWVLSVTEVLSVLLIYFLGTTRSLVIHEPPKLYHFSYWHSLEDVVGLSCTRAVLLSAAYAAGMQHMHRPYLYSACLLACLCFPYLVVKMILFRYGQDAVPAAAIFIITNLFCWIHVFAARHSVEFARRRYQLGLGTGYPWEDDLGLLAPDSWNPLLMRRGGAGGGGGGGDQEEGGSKSSGDLAGLAYRGSWGTAAGGGWVGGGGPGEDVPPETLADVDSKFLQIGGIKVHYKEVVPSTFPGSDEGQQLGIVLLHGFGAGVFAWRHIMEPLALQCQCRVVAFDRIGFGLTSRPSVLPDQPNPYALGAQAHLLLQLCRALGLSKVLLVAHADGCLLALRAASMAIRSAMLSDSPRDTQSGWEAEGLEAGQQLLQPAGPQEISFSLSHQQQQQQMTGGAGDMTSGSAGSGGLLAGTGLAAAAADPASTTTAVGPTSNNPVGLPPTGRQHVPQQHHLQGSGSNGSSVVEGVGALLVNAPHGSPSTEAVSSATFSAAGMSRTGQDISVMSLQCTSDQVSMPSGSMEITLGGGWQQSVRSDTSLLGRLDSMDQAMLNRYAKGGYARTIDIYPGEHPGVQGYGVQGLGGVDQGGRMWAPEEVPMNRQDVQGVPRLRQEGARHRRAQSTPGPVDGRSVYGRSCYCSHGQLLAEGAPGQLQACQQGSGSPTDGSTPQAGPLVTILGLALLHPNLSGTQGPVLSRLLAGSRLGRSILRPLLRSEVGEVANRRAWHNTHKLTSEVLDLYKAPLRVEGWCESLIEITGLKRDQAQGDLSHYLMDVQDLPALLLTGEYDRVVPPPKVELLSADLPRSRMCTVSGCGHLSHEESPAALLGQLVPFCGQAMQEEQQQQGARAVQAAGPLGQMSSSQDVLNNLP